MAENTTWEDGVPLPQRDTSYADYNSYSDLHSIQRNLPPSPNAPGPVLVPGDPERIHMKTCDDSGGIAYHSKLVTHYNDFAVKIGVEPLPFQVFSDDS